MFVILQSSIVCYYPHNHGVTKLVYKSVFKIADELLLQEYISNISDLLRASQLRVASAPWWQVLLMLLLLLLVTSAVSILKHF